MPTQTSVLLDAMGPQVGYGMPFGGPYTNVYGTTPGAQSAENAYWDTLQRGYQNQSQQLVRDAYGKVKPSMMGDEYDWSNAISVDPTTGKSTLDYSKLSPDARRAADATWWQNEFQRVGQDTNEDRAQARQQLELLAQKQMAQQARTQQQAAERSAFQQELQRYNAPDIMAQMINPQIQNAGNQVIANANAAGMAGGSMGQAANRRAAMAGFGQQAANVVPQAAVSQADLNFQYQKAREGMINNYYGMQNQRAQQDISNQMALTGFQKGMEEYEHNRSRENLEAVGSFMGNVGAFAGQVAPFMKFGGGQQGGK